ncbi:uncharacterized protein LOC118423786 [Branchiostoma floridae]|uniref:Uncharacterized protein LOC118423786 n=1 Tax=Branchiostoma floridae TaxID=7739 RepID=A0A9J7LSK9_BRAFL|nr:uncharacterized protein LOC118423786 [Branchiostoma floridae]XP_035687904.1 uncharacterized protein LOC118423786 [Branchiostoma floridae]
MTVQKSSATQKSKKAKKTAKEKTTVQKSSATQKSKKAKKTAKEKTTVQKSAATQKSEEKDAAEEASAVEAAAEKHPFMLFPQCHMKYSHAGLIDAEAIDELGLWWPLAKHPLLAAGQLCKRMQE